MTGRRICKECGAEFALTRKDKIYCSQKCCREAHKRMTNDKLKEETTGVRMIKPVHNPVNKNTLEEMAVKARKAGMSYGQYIAQTEYKQVIARRGKNKCTQTNIRP